MFKINSLNKLNMFSKKLHFMCIFTSLFLFSCSGNELNSVPVDASEPNAITDLTLNVFNDDCRASDILSVKTGTTGRLHFLIHGASLDTYAVAFKSSASESSARISIINTKTLIGKSDSGQPAPQIKGDIIINNAEANDYSISLVARNLTSCLKIKPSSECRVNGKKLKNTMSYDKTKNIVFAVSYDGGETSSSSGSNIFSQVGTAVLSTVSSSVLGFDIGSILGSGNNNNTNQTTEDPLKDKCKNGWPSS